MTDPVGVKVEALVAWLAERVELVAPLSVEMIIGGRSNLTYKLTDAAGTSWVLRRPPTGNVLESAHDVLREQHIMGSLAASAIPVPVVVDACDDRDVIGAPFFVMEFVDGLAIRDVAQAEALSSAVRHDVSRNLMKVMAELHRLDPADVGLDTLSRGQDYVARQLKRWERQFTAITTRSVPLMGEVHQRLLAQVPPQESVGIVHGDYRLDNCLVSEAGDVMAVLDWELSTLGDTRADLGQTLVYWSAAGDSLQALAGSPTVAEGFASREEIVEWYESESGQAADHLGFFVAFANWRLACILEGVYTRYSAGSMGDSADVYIDGFGRTVLELLGRANAILDGADPIGSN